MSASLARIDVSLPTHGSWHKDRKGQLRRIVKIGQCTDRKCTHDHAGCCAFVPPVTPAPRDRFETRSPKWSSTHPKGTRCPWSTGTATCSE